MPIRFLISMTAVAIVATSLSRAEPPAKEPTAADREHWSFRPPIRPPLPSPRTTGWVRTPVDRFILVKLEAVGVDPAPDADRRTLIRRVFFDLTGLPPTPGQVEDFLADTAPDAYEKVVDKLLASPHFGERWAQHWLDVVRFAETNGYELDADRPHAWRYRDYVARSFNADKPYDRFLTEQIAGDLLAAGKDPKAVPDLLIATGMHRCGPNHVVSGNLDPAMIRQENLTEMVNGVGAAVLGLTVGCARCHDHKFDPLPQADYYRLQAFFAAARYKEVSLVSREDKTRHQNLVEEVENQTAPLKKQVGAIEAPYRARLAAEKRAALDTTAKAALSTPTDKRTEDQKKLVKNIQPLLKVEWDEVLAALSPDDRERRQKLRDQIHALEATIPPPPAHAWAVVHEEPVPKTFLLKRGDVGRYGAEVRPGLPRVLVSADVNPKDRLDLAKWLTRPDHPLTARVIVNRLWQHYFGRGIVGTPNDFGTRGDPPTHPELLDWLARELVEPTTPGGVGKPAPWSLKRIHRLIVTSAAYRQASRVAASEAAKKVDPDNRLLWRQNRKRLEAEAIRDAVLAAAGTLNREIGGPSVRVPLEPEVYDLIFTEAEPDNLWPVTPDLRQHTRRSFYLLAKRNVRLPMLEAFDQPDALTPCAARAVSTFAPQALILMNGPFTQDQSRRLASKLAWEGTRPDEWIDGLFRRALGRLPTDAERRKANGFLIRQVELVRDRLLTRQPVAMPPDLPGWADPAASTALADLCLAVFYTNEFVYVP
jgi:hypothetical protein